MGILDSSESMKQTEGCVVRRQAEGSVSDNIKYIYSWSGPL